MNIKLFDSHLFPFQSRTVRRTRKALAAGRRRVLIVGPTGCGKTTIAAALALPYARVLFIVHRKELIWQTVLSLAKADPYGRAVTMIAGGKKFDPHAPIIVASVQSLTRRDAMPEVDIIIVDEAHHYAKNEWSAVLGVYGHIPIIGLTATPEREDGRALGDMYEEIVVAAQYSELIPRFIVPATLIEPVSLLHQRGLVVDPVMAWMKYAGDRKGFVFCQTMPEAVELAKRLAAAGVPTECITHKTSNKMRQDIMRRFSEGELRCLTTYLTLTEGVDQPAAEVAMIARTFGHVGALIQSVGRVLRTAPGKFAATIIDLTGTIAQHGSPTADRTFSLSGRAISEGAGWEDGREAAERTALEVLANGELRVSYAAPGWVPASPLEGGSPYVPQPKCCMNCGVPLAKYSPQTKRCATCKHKATKEARDKRLEDPAKLKAQRERERNYQRKRLADPVKRAVVRERERKLLEDPAKLKAKNERNRKSECKRLEDPARREARREVANAQNRKRMEDPVKREAVRERARKRLEDPAKRETKREKDRKSQRKRAETKRSVNKAT